MKSVSAAIIVLAGVVAYAAGAINSQHMSGDDKIFLEKAGQWLLFLGTVAWIVITFQLPVRKWTKETLEKFEPPTK